MAKKSGLPTPAEAREPDADDDAELTAARVRLARAIKGSKGKGFTYAASLFPAGTDKVLIAELRASGWTVVHVPDSRDGDYYNINPKR